MPRRFPDLEALGLRYLESRASAAAPAADPTDPVHILNRREQDALRRIEWFAVGRAALAGALSAMVSAVTELLMTGRAGNAAYPDLDVTGWVVVVAATVVATGFEIAYLYWDALRSVHDLAVAAGVQLFPPGVPAGRATAVALARAALELPNRPDPRLGVDPYREASRTALLVAALLYKAKIGLTNVLAKLLIGRLGGRTALRGWLPFVAVPITALWNAWVARMVLHEARLRAMAPSAAQERIDALLNGKTLSPPARVAAMRAVACAVVGKRDLHPNLALLLHLLRERLAVTDQGLDDRAAFLTQLPTLSTEERDVVLAVLTFALIFDGRLSFRERRVLAQAQAACGLPPSMAEARALRWAFVRGRTMA